MSVYDAALQADNELHKLIEKPEERFVGFAYDVSYGGLEFLTNDHWKERVGGIPHNSFLIATAINPARGKIDPLDEEILLLRVTEPVPLPQAGELLRTRIERHQRRGSDELLPGDTRPRDHRPGQDVTDTSDRDGFDWLTAAELQSSGLRCRIIGTFHLENHELRLGSDIENYMAMSPLRVYKPDLKSLETIVNHVNSEVKAKAEKEAKEAGFAGTPSPIVIGHMRYTSTRRLQRLNKQDSVEVRINPSDFLARRTAILGMTRTGKSNTVKTTIGAVALAAMKDQIKVGQIIFDLNGEYANANNQDDGSSIAEVFTDETVRYRAMATPGFEDLRPNFYRDPAGALELMRDLYNAETNKISTAQDFKQFFGLELSPPVLIGDSKIDVRATKRWHNRVLVFALVLSEAEFPGAPTVVKVPFGEDLQKQVMEGLGAPSAELIKSLEAGKAYTAARSGLSQVTLSEAKEWMRAIRQANLNLKNGIPGRKGSDAPILEKNYVGIKTASEPWVDTTLEVLLNMLASTNSGGTGFIGSRGLKGYRDYHSEQRSEQLEAQIMKHIEDGKIVILDLSVGPTSIRKVLAERIARHIFETQMRTLHSGKPPQNVVLYVEEAHNLIGRDADLDSTWPRLAKEGAKGRIAFVYATQEPSSVHPNILANTENWFVTHLNNEDELRALSKFYDFADFKTSLKSAQDVGFARIKTLSSPFVTPVQILRFTPAELQEKRADLLARQR